MGNLPSGTERLPHFIPTQDLNLSRRFHVATGFEMALEGDVFILNPGSGGFILQRAYHPEWAEHCMMRRRVVAD